MKSNAIVRIIIYAVVIILLVSLLAMCLGADAFMFRTSSGSDEHRQHMSDVSADAVSKLEIDWAAGSITVKAADTDTITITESGNFSDKYAMSYDVEGSTLSIDYAKTNYTIGMNSLPSKDLMITVPQDWYCEALEIDGAALDVEITDVSVNAIELDGASMEFSFNGALNQLDCDGASCELDVTSSVNLSRIDISGASCKLNLTIPTESGFQVQMEGLGCKFESDVDYTLSYGAYLHGDGHCRINVDGLSCSVSIQHVTQEFLPTVPYDGSNR